MIKNVYKVTIFSSDTFWILPHALTPTPPPVSYTWGIHYRLRSFLQRYSVVEGDGFILDIPAREKRMFSD